ncbi:hypothetical protein HYV43_07395 [Candidatus Micrarchaeota archaeon]|nr:hypothetical protein [Candidatus Micrarchaeota archaeon]
MVKGWFSAVVSLFSVFALVALLGLSSDVHAASQGICSSNGLPVNGGYDCVFIRDPTSILGCFDQSYPCDASFGGPSKYVSGCVGTTYYDFTRDSGVLSRTWFNPQTNKCEYVGDYCDAFRHGIPNDPRCGYVQPGPGPQPSIPPYIPPAPGPAPYPVPQPPLYPYCGNNVCEYGEDMFNCPYDCSLFVPYPFISSCSLSSFPSNVQAGGSSTIAVNYFNTPFEPLSTLVYCGNGQVSLAYGCYGFSGVCFAYCQYPQAGTFTATANAGGTFCSGTRVTARPVGGGPTPGPGPGPGPGPAPTVAPSPSCAVSTNPSSLTLNGSTTVTVAYNNFQGTPNGNIVCGDGQSLAASCIGNGQGSCTATCTYPQPSSLPSRYIVSSTLNGISCRNGGVTLQASGNPGTLLVTVVNQTFDAISGAAVQVDNGAVQFTNLSGQTQYTLSAGEYSVRASKAKHSSAVTNAIVRADRTTPVTLQLVQDFNPLCKVSATPSSIRGGSSTVVSVSYFDAPSMPSNVLINCGNGQSAPATCSGTPAQGSCTASCFYAAEADLPRSFSVSSNVAGFVCTPQSVSVVPALPGTGTLLARVSACTDGRLLSNAQLRISTPQSLIPTDFNGDGVHSLVPPQTVRADNGFIVRLDSVQQVPASAQSPLTFSTGSQSFPTTATDTTTVDLSFVRVQSSLAQPFKFGNSPSAPTDTNNFYYITDRTPAGQGAQGVVFYRDPTTSNFVPYLHPGAEGNVTYAAGTTINGSSLSGVSIVNSTTNAGCNTTYTTATNLGSFSGYVLTSPITINSGRPTVAGYAMSGFSGSAQVSAPSVNASCSAGNFTLSFSNAAGALGPGLGVGQYAIAYNYVEFNYGVPVIMQFYAPGVSVGTTDPNAGNGYVIAVPEYLTDANVTQGAWMLDVGYGDQSTPRLLAANAPATIGYDASFSPRDVQADVQPSGFLSPRGSVGTTALTSATINYALTLSGPAATVSFLNPQGASVQQNVLRVGEATSTANVYARTVTIAGNTTRLEVRSVTAATPTNTTVFFTNEFGQSQAQLSPGTYNVEFFKEGFGVSRATVTIDAARTNSQAICLQPRSCDFAVEMVSAPTCSFNSDQYQLRISNSQNVSKNVTLTYSTTEIDGPQIVALPPQQSTIINLRTRSASPAVSGQSLGIVNVAGPDSCTQSFTLPLCIAQEIVLQAPQNRVSVTPGTTTCNDVLVKNRALQTVKVALTAGSSSPSVSGVFSPDEFMLSSLEVKTVPLCVSAQAGFSGQGTLSLAAHSPLGQANESIGVDVFGQTFFSSDFSGCPIIDAGRTTYYSLNLQNNDGAGDFVFHLEDNTITTRDDFVLQQFQKGEVRQVVIPLEPFGNRAGRQLFNAFLQKDGHTVFQQSLCFEVRGSAGTQLDIQPNPLDVPRGQTRSALLSVRNVGNLRSEYQVQNDGQPLSVRVSPRSFQLEPNQEQVVDVQVSAASSLETKSYVVPLSLYARSALQTADEQYSTDVQCGSGQTKTVSCPSGTGSCSVICAYPNTGTFTPSATVAGRTCSVTSSSVRVIDSTSNTCILQSSPNNVDRGAAITVSATYNTLSSAFNGTLAINCGNGQIVTAQNCNGNTGACSAVCNYPAEGNFVLTASQGATNCYTAQVAVGNPSSTSCQVTAAQNTVVRGDSATIQLRYYNLPTTSTSTSLNIPVFQGSQNLLVNVLSTSDTISLSTAELTLLPIAPQTAFAGTSVHVPVRVKNENYFAINDVLLYADRLPSGFSAPSVPRFSLSPGQERTVDLVIDVGASVPPSTVVLAVVAQSALTREARQNLLLTVVPSTADRLNVDASVQVTYREENGQVRFILDTSLTNREPVALLLTPSLVLNESWPASFQPRTISLAPNGAGSVQGQVVPSAFDAQRSYPAIVRLRSADGRFKDVPIELSRQGGLFTGFLGLGDAAKFFNDLFSGRLSEDGLLFYVGVFLLLLAVAALFFAAMHWHVFRGG